MAIKLSVVIPVYNEAPGLADTLRRFAATLQAAPHIEAFEAVIVDDGSDDGAFQRVTLPSFARLLRHSTNSGYGASLKTGIRAALHPVIAICDADGSYTIEMLPQLLAVHAPTTLVVAARQSIPYAQLGAIKRLARGVFTFWLWTLTGCWIRDINSGMRVFERDAILPILDRLSDRFSFTTGTTIQWILAARPIVYVSTPYAKRQGESKVNFVRDGAGVIRQVLRMLFHRHPLRTGAVIVTELFVAGGIAALIFS